MDKNGGVWGFGGNECGQLGLGVDYKAVYAVGNATKNPYLNGIKFIQCGFDFSLCIDKDGKAYTFGYNGSGECGAGHTDNIDIPFCIQSKEELDGVVFVSGSCGHEHTVLITKDNNLYGFGDNYFHQIGQFIQEMN